MNLNDVRTSPKARGKRLLRLRRMANFIRSDIENKYPELKSETFKAWELGRFNGISMKGAKKVIQMFAKEGIKCSLDWLLYDIGSGPQVFEFDIQSGYCVQELSSKQMPEYIAITKELSFFRELHEHSIDFVVEDDTMVPRFLPGEYVAGVKRYDDKMEEAIGQDCILQTQEGRLLLRHLHSKNVDGTFNLRCKNLETKVKDYVLDHVALLSAAPVIWMRRKE